VHLWMIFALFIWMIVYGSMDNFCEFMDDFVLIHGFFLVYSWMISCEPCESNIESNHVHRTQDNHYGGPSCSSTSNIGSIYA
jgi:hypothetical protein